MLTLTLDTINHYALSSGFVFIILLSITEEDKAVLHTLKAEHAAKHCKKEHKLEARQALAKDPTYDDEPHCHRREPADYDDKSLDEIFPTAPRTLSHCVSRVPPRVPVSDNDNDNDECATFVSKAPVANEPQSPDGSAKHPYNDNSNSDNLPLKQPRLLASCPKLADYPTDTQEILVRAIQLWRLQIFTTNAFPTVQDEATWVGEVWTKACMQLNATCTLDAKAFQLITS
ncbi:hypothetical protein ONZ45_g17997 [Pleurotus djamor]|nr:hypothetical protein ONZ45_g17997 [Pleurotus djamor]